MVVILLVVGLVSLRHLNQAEIWWSALSIIIYLLSLALLFPSRLINTDTTGVWQRFIKIKGANEEDKLPFHFHPYCFSMILDGCRYSSHCCNHMLIVTLDTTSIPQITETCLQLSYPCKCSTTVEWARITDIILTYSNDTRIWHKDKALDIMVSAVENRCVVEHLPALQCCRWVQLHACNAKAWWIVFEPWSHSLERADQTPIPYHVQIISKVCSTHCPNSFFRARRVSFSTPKVRFVLPISCCRVFCKSQPSTDRSPSSLCGPHTA